MIPLPLLLLVAALYVGVNAALERWNRVTVWLGERILPVIQTYLPTLADCCARVFTVLEVITEPAVQAMREAWETVREHLCGMLATYERQHDGTWLERVCLYVREDLLEAGQVREVTRERIVDVSDLPPEVRENGTDQGSIDLMKATEAAMGVLEQEA